MYLGKREHFRCNTCRTEKSVKSGLPEGWVWLKTGGEVAHACGSCKLGIPVAKHMKAGQKN